MINDYKAAERFAPIADDQPLPAKVDTLEYIPPQFRDNYRRTMDGGFRLYYVSGSDLLNYTASLDDIAAGRVKVFPEGETQASMAAAEAARRAVSVNVLAAVDAMTAKMMKDAQDSALLRLDQKKQSLQADFDRRAQGYVPRPPGLK